MFYTTKLQVHNFTLFSLDTSAGYCNVWDGCNGGLISDIVVWLQYQHFNAFLEANRDIKTLIIWSDGCGYQNNWNATVSNYFLHLAKPMQVTVIQTFLISGHTQMECDSMHSIIERQVAGRMYSPRYYVVVMRSAAPERLIGLIMLKKWRSATALVDFMTPTSPLSALAKNRGIQSSIIFAPCATQMLVLSIKLTFMTSAHPSHNASRPPATLN